MRCQGMDSGGLTSAAAARLVHQFARHRQASRTYLRRNLSYRTDVPYICTESGVYLQVCFWCMDGELYVQSRFRGSAKRAASVMSSALCM
jgi:hypothetical protein